MARLSTHQIVMIYGLAGLVMLAMPGRALAASLPCTLAQITGKYQTQYGPLTCDAAAGHLKCCYGDAACRNTVELSLDLDRRSVSGTWKHADGTDGRTTFPLTSDCQLSDGKWGWGQDVMNDGWRITAKPAPVVTKKAEVEIPLKIELPPIHPDLASPPDIPLEDQRKATPGDPLTEAAKAFLKEEKERLNKALEANRRKEKEVSARIEKNKKRQAEVENRIRELCGGRICQLLADGQIIYRTDTYDPPLWYFGSGRLAPRHLWPNSP